MVTATEHTLPAWLVEQARRRPDAPALRHKRLGTWTQSSWRALAQKVQALACGLHLRGFGAGDVVLIVGQPCEEALLLALAAQWCGGAAAPFDPSSPDGLLEAIVRHLEPRFCFAGDDVQVDRLLALSQHVIDANPRDLRAHPHPDVLAYRTLVLQAGDIRPLAQPGTDAFIFFRHTPGLVLVEQRVNHAMLIREAQLVVAKEQLNAGDDAFAARAFATAAQARYLVAPWLLTGFCLNVPESMATRDNDRRELAPTLVAGTRETYGRVARYVDARLPPGASIRRRLLDALADEATPALWRFIAWWFVVRPLREVIGFKRTRAALVVGAPLDQDAARLFKTLRVDVRAWPDEGEWRATAPRESSAPVAADVRGLAA